jgi:putative flippase GtrA
MSVSSKTQRTAIDIATFLVVALLLARLLPDRLNVLAPIAGAIVALVVRWLMQRRSPTR